MASSSNSYQGRLALVTGGSQGIGLALARLLAEQGANVWLLARHANALEAACRSLNSSSGQKHGYYAVDVTDRAQVQSTVARFQQEVGVPDVLVNAAGGAHPGYLQETSPEVFHEMMDLNYFGTVNMVMATLPAMLKRGSGYIVNFSSMGGFLAPFGYAAYSPAKFAVRGFSDILRLEMKPLGIRVSVVFPPDTNTPGMANENKTKPFETLEAFSSKLVSPEYVATRVLHGMKSGRYVILPGSEPNLYYRLVLLVGNGIYPIVDMVLGQARRKKQQVKGSNGHL